LLRVLSRTATACHLRDAVLPCAQGELLHKLVQDSDVGILYITHDLLSARMLADEVIVLNNGKIVEQGEAINVIRNPEDEYTRQLLEAIPNPFADIPA
jgi:peptide/nickel transport system ATP-binding protein